MSELLTRLDNARMTPLHRRLAWSAGLGIFLDGYDLSIIAVVQKALGQTWKLTAYELGAIAAASLAGAFFGAMLAGRIADRWGRKAIYLIDLLTFLVAAILCSVAWDPWSLAIFRFVLGVGIGADYPLSATYMSEFMPVKKRGAVITWAFGLWIAGAFASKFVGLALLHLPPHISWRLMFLSGAFPAAAVVWLRNSLPESPRWYLRNGQSQKAMQVLQQVDPTITDTEASSILARQMQTTQTPRLHWSVLFSRRYLRVTLFCALPWFMMDLMAYPIGNYEPALIHSLGVHSYAASVLAAMALDLVFLLGYIPLALTVDRTGRVFPQTIGFLGNALGLGLIGFFALRHPAAAPPILVVAIGLILFQVANSYGPGSTTYLIPAEAYPTDLRASGHGFATAFSRIGAVMGTFLLPEVQKLVGDGWLMMMMAAIGVLGAALTAGLAVETGGKPLEDPMPIALTIKGQPNAPAPPL